MTDALALKKYLTLCLGGMLLAFSGSEFFLQAETLAASTFTLSSPAFTNGGTLPKEFTCDGKRASPPLAWVNPPVGTKFFALTMHHIPGPGDKHVYLVIYNIPANVSSLQENSRDIGTWGINTVNGKQEYTPPCSKGPGPKLYTMTAYALSSVVKIDGPPSSVTMDMLLAAIKDKTLATSAISVTYSRPGNGNSWWWPFGGGGGGGADPHQPPGGSGPRLPPELERGLASLTLSSDQKQKVDAIVQDYQGKQRQLRENLLQQLKGTLDATQYAKIEASLQKPPPLPPGDAAQTPSPPSSGETPPAPTNP